MDAHIEDLGSVEERCDRCRFSRKRALPGPLECRKSTPVILGTPVGLERGAWPGVMADDWCGAFERDA